MNSQSTARPVRRKKNQKPPELPTLIIQIAILLITIINCTNFSLQYSRYLNETRSPESLPTVQIRSR